jgi:hypothetical protein
MTRTVRHDRIGYIVADDDPMPHDAKWWAVLRTRAVDELTGEPPLSRITLRTNTPGCLPRVADDGLCGLVARPRSVSAQMLTVGAFTAEIHAEGYLPRSLTAAIDAARRTTPSAAQGVQQLTVAPRDPAPPEPPTVPRRQFLPGRGVLLETRVVNEPHMFTLTADPIVPPAVDIVPLTAPVQLARPALGAPWQVAGVPIVLPDQPLHRAQPAIVRGRAMRQDAQPAAGGKLRDAHLADIGLTGVWWTYDEIPATSSPPHKPDLVVFGAPLAFDHVAGTLERLTARTPDGVVRATAAPAFAGATEIELTSVTGLNGAGGDALELEQANSAERELVMTSGYTTPISTTAAVVRLRTPLAFSHRGGMPVVRAPLAFAALGSLAREAQCGDRVLFASALVNVATDDVLRIAGGTPRAELRFVHRLPFYDTTTGLFSHPLTLGLDGSFMLPAIARVAQLQLFVQHGGQAAHPPIDLVPDYCGDNTLQILFKPI